MMSQGRSGAGSSPGENHAVIGIGATLNQRFTLDAELGRGGMGAVYRATDQILGRSVAIKVLKEHGTEEVGKRIRLEAQILARLLHENVVRLYDFGEAEGGYFLVMEEVDGSSFSKRWRQVPLAERLRINGQVAAALDYAHHQGVIHRDVKPANVLLTAADHAKLSDFGLSMMAEAVEETGVIRGTPPYMSPEQARGKRLDHRTDLYSLGIMIYECVTGSVPFTGQAMSVLAQHVNGTVRPPRSRNPEVSPELEALILSLLAKNPEERPVSGDVVAKALLAESELARLRKIAAGPGAGPGGAEFLSTQAAGSPAATLGATVNAPGLDETAPRVVPGPEAPTIGATATPAPAQAPVLAPVPALAPAPKPALAPVPSVATVRVASPLAREMLETVLAEPLIVSADERYLCGHYLAYLLGGSRRQGFFLRRPLDPRNADRARLLLAMTWLMQIGPGEGGANVTRAASLLDARTDVRAALNPVVVMKYLNGRNTPAKRKVFRQARKLLQEASPYARKAMLDTKGALNPGLIPQGLDDLRKVAPARDDVDDTLVARWNRVAEVWRDAPEFRRAVLKYATKNAHRDPASIDLWPEVVYPLIERARWQRQFRPKQEAVWDYLCARVLHVPDAGVRLDRMMVRSVPVQVAAELEDDLLGFADDPRLADDEPATGQAEGDDRLSSRIIPGPSLHDLADDAPRDTSLIPLSPADPFRFTQGELRDLWREALAALTTGVKPGGKPAGHRHVPVGPYRLAVIPSIRGKSAGQVALQGMHNKQIEMLTPSIRVGGSGGKPVIAVWVYADASAVIVYLDFRATVKYIFWHAPNAQQFNYDDPADLNHLLFTIGMEVPDQLDRVLTKKFRPQSKA